MKHTYYCRHHPDRMREAIAYVGLGATITGTLRRESRALKWAEWTLAEMDLIRLAAIARRQALAYRNDSCTIVERLRKGRARAPQS